MTFRLIHTQNRTYETIQTFLPELEGQKFEIVLFQRKNHVGTDLHYKVIFYLLPYFLCIIRQYKVS